MEAEKALKLQTNLDTVIKERDELKAFASTLTEQNRSYMTESKVPASIFS